MTAFFKVVENGYIDGFGTNGNDETTAITESEYAKLQAAFRTMPAPKEGYVYRLREDLTWEEVEAPPEDPDVDDAEAFGLLFGGAE